jgi:hypothetical protein
MKDHGGDRKAPSESRLKLACRGRPSVGDKDDFTKPPTVSQSHVQPRQKDAISPPPLKRQRTTCDDFSSDTHDLRPTTLQAHPLTGPSALRHRYVSFRGNAWPC